MTGKHGILFSMLTIVLFGLSCGDRDRVEGGTDPGDTLRPTVVSASPAAGATDVGLAVPITVTFSEAMDPTTLTGSSIGVTGYASHGRIVYDPSTLTATVALDTLLAGSTSHTIYVSQDAADEAGNGAEPFTRAFQTGPVDCPHIADRYEPNDDAAASTLVDVGEARRLLTSCSDDRDVYRFTLSAAQKITVTTPILDAPADSSGYPSWQIHYMREDGQYYSTMGTSADPDNPPGLRYTFLPGTYFVEIFPYHELDPGKHILYDLEVSAGAPCEDDPFEDNDFPDMAAPLEPGHHAGMKGCYVDQDCYTVPVAAGQTLVLILDATIPGGAWGHRRLHLRPPGGTTVTYSGTDNPDTLEVTSETDGSAEIDVRFWVDGVDYSLDLRYGDGPGAHRSTSKAARSEVPEVSREARPPGRE